MFDSTCSVLENIKKKRSIYSQKGDANAASKLIQLFEFIFTLHLMKEVIGIIDVLCQALQQKISRHFECYTFGFKYKDVDLEIERRLLK